jgi:hypothetical protein
MYHHGGPDPKRIGEIQDTRTRQGQGAEMLRQPGDTGRVGLLREGVEFIARHKVRQGNKIFHAGKTIN